MNRRTASSTVPIKKHILKVKCETSSTCLSYEQKMNERDFLEEELYAITSTFGCDRQKTEMNERFEMCVSLHCSVCYTHVASQHSKNTEI